MKLKVPACVHRYYWLIKKITTKLLHSTTYPSTSSTAIFLLTGMVFNVECVYFKYIQIKCHNYVIERGALLCHKNGASTVSHIHLC